MFGVVLILFGKSSIVEGGIEFRIFVRVLNSVREGDVRNVFFTIQPFEDIGSKMVIWRLPSWIKEVNKRFGQGGFAYRKSQW